MYEVEVKVPADHAPVRKALADADATHLGAVTQEDTYYNAPHRDFVETDEAVRIRWERDESGGETVITYKGPKVDADSKSRNELETAVDDGDVLDEILEQLGFDPVPTVSKERDRFELYGYTVSLDTVTGAGTFVEVETEAESVPDARDGAFDVLETLGLDPADQIRASYLELVLGDAVE
jgi:adenylate cyclase class 2